MAGPLEDVRVLDLTRLLPGGFATSLLADLGAEVIKIEQPGTGDYMRWGDPKIGDESAHSWITDRNKQSVALDLKSRRGVAAFKQLVTTTDIVFESFRPGVVDRLGIGYDEICELNPAIVYCSMSGYGQDGPLAYAVGHDINYVGRAGILSITGPADGVPTVPGVQTADLAGASLSLVGMLAALHKASRTGEGDYIDIAMSDAAFSWLSIHMGAYFADGQVPSAERMMLTGLYPCYRVYECADGRFLTVGALEPQFFIRLCDVMGLEDRIADQFDPEAVEDWKRIFLERDRGTWLALFDGHDVCVGPVNNFAEAATDSQITYRDMVVSQDHMSAGTHRQVGTPLKLKNSPAAIKTPAPRLGQHTEERLAEAGVDREEIEYLLKVQRAASRQ